MQYAKNHQLILITKDLHFGNINVYPPELHHGIIVLRLPFFFSSNQISRVIVNFLKTIDKKDLENALTIVKIEGYRIKKKRIYQADKKRFQHD
jgi:predicted nuclease of predicted toxin-antitoxin system